MKKKVINNLARRLQKKYPRLYNSVGTKRVKRILGGIFGEHIFHHTRSADHVSATIQ